MYGIDPDYYIYHILIKSYKRINHEVSIFPLFQNVPHTPALRQLFLRERNFTGGIELLGLTVDMSKSLNSVSQLNENIVYCVGNIYLERGAGKRSG